MFDPKELNELAHEARQAADADLSVLSIDELLAAASKWELALAALDAAGAQMLAEVRARGLMDQLRDRLSQL